MSGTKEIDVLTSRDVTREQGMGWLAMMVRIRHFEQRLAELYRRGKLVGVVHLSIGQEAVPTGVCAHLVEGDQITSTHRGHHHMLARGLVPQRMFAEILARADGYCRGKGGSMHVCSVADGAVGANGIVGGGIAMAVGLAYAARTTGRDSVAVTFFGDGAANQGVLYESLNLAALWRAPVLFVCENNGYNEFTPTDDVTAGPGIHARAASFGVPSEVVDGSDVAAVYERSAEAIARARAGEGPTLLECRVTRMSGHHEGEESYAGVYRESPREGDPIERLESDLAGLGIAEEEIERVEAEEREAVEQALAAAQESPPPPVEWAHEDVFA